jgi:hypothetical protein
VFGSAPGWVEGESGSVLPRLMDFWWLMNGDPGVIALAGLAGAVLIVGMCLDR